MRKIHEEQYLIGQVQIDEIEFDLRSRDEIPKLLMGLQYIYCHEEYRKKIFAILKEMLPKGISSDNGRPGMTCWKILVLGTLRLNCNWDYDKVKEIADNHMTLRLMLGHSLLDRETKYPIQTIKDNVGLFTPEILNKINKIVVDAGHTLVKKNEIELYGRCDSFVVETDVHYPTDINLLFDAMNKILTLVSRISDKNAITTWRQSDHLLKKLKRLYREAQKCTNSIRRSKTDKARKEKKKVAAYKIYIEAASELVNRAKMTIKGIDFFDLTNFAIVYSIENYIGHAERQIDQIRRRVLQGEKIPHEEKVFSIFEEHTEWISKGKAGVPQELGLMVCILEDQYGFILDHEVMERITDEKMVVPFITRAVELYPELKSCSFDKNYYTPQNKVELEKILERVVLPKKGRLTEEEKIEVNDEEYKFLRRKHSAVEAGISALENHGLDRCLDHGIFGFKRYVALSVVARNLQNLGNKLFIEKLSHRKRETDNHSRLKARAA
jgi:IS5 family transposase